VSPFSESIRKYNLLYNKYKELLPIDLTLLQEEELSNLVDEEISKEENLNT
jgi:hypothetical protein